MKTFSTYITEAKISKQNLNKVANIFKRIFEKEFSTKLYRFGGDDGYTEIQHGLGILYFYNKNKAMRLNYIDGAIKSITLWKAYKLGQRGDFTIDLDGLGLLAAGKHLFNILRNPRPGEVHTYGEYLDEEYLSEAKRIRPDEFAQLVHGELPPGKSLSKLNWDDFATIALKHDYQIPTAVRGTRTGGSGQNTIFDLSVLLTAKDANQKNSGKPIADYYIKITAQDPLTKKFLSVKGDTVAQEMLSTINNAVQNPDINKEMMNADTLFGRMKNLVQVVCRGARNSLVVYGGPGIGKCAAPEELLGVKLNGTKTILTYKALFDMIVPGDVEYEKIYACTTSIEVETPDGWIPILGVMKKLGSGVRLKTETGKVFHGEQNHLILTPTGWEYMKDVSVVLTKDGIPEAVVEKEITEETQFYDISLPPPHAYYSPNGLVHHNTFMITKTIAEEGLAKNKDWYIIKGKITTSALYQTLFMHRKRTLLVFDDTDSVFGDQDAANILKAALDSYEERVISWVSPRTVNVSKMTDEEKEKFNDDIDLKILNDPEGKVKLPSEFVYEGRIIFISNLTHDKFDSAILNRSAKIDMTLTQEQIFQRMEGILDHLGDKSVDISVKKEIFDFLKQQNKSGTITNASMRTFTAAVDLYKSGLPNWKELLEYT